MVMADCPYTKVAVMQLFYELKEKFPTIPDQVVSDYMYQASFNRQECERRLREEYQHFQIHSYPVSIVDKMTEGKERPKTLPISNWDCTTPYSNLLKPNSRLPLVQEEKNTFWAPQACRPSEPKPSKQGKADSRTSDSKLDSAAYHKTAFSADNKQKADQALADMGKSVQNIEIASDQGDVFVSDVKLCVQNDTCGCERTSLEVKYDKKEAMNGGSHSAPTTPSSCQKSLNCDLKDGVVRKHRSSLDVDRSAMSPCIAESKRPSTSVMLTLRPPSTEAKPPINIATNGSQLTYRTSSYDATQGYRNQLEISISDDHTTMTASRQKTNTIPNIACSPLVSTPVQSILPAFDNKLSTTLELRLHEQKMRKQRLEMELKRSKQTLREIQHEVFLMERDMERRKKAPLKSEKVLRLQEEVSALQNECQKMYIESESMEQSTISLPSVSAVANDSGRWMCSMCTFLNHPILPKCEQCEMVRVDGSRLPNILRPPTAAAQLPAIHPRV